MRLYVDPIATSCRPVVASVYALDLAVDRVNLSLMRGDHTAPGFRAVSPAGKVPVLVDGDFTLTESAAIAHYLCDRTASPLGGRAGRGRARVNEALHWISSTLTVPFCHDLVYPRLLPQFRWDDPTVAQAVAGRARARVHEALDHLEGRVLQGRPCLAGDELTIADFFGMSVLSLADTIDFSFEPWPEVRDWMTLVGDTPAWRRLDGELRLLLPMTAAPG